MMEDFVPEKNEKVARVFAGNLEDLPPLSSKIVRIFTSSTFTDTTLERNALMENVYPKIKEYCREKQGLEFQVVDMRWGVRDEATDDHMTTELCMKEIENCQRLSVGPNFVVFLGQKYGYRPIPTIIPATELEMLREVIKDVPADAELLDTWYKRDDNAVPAEYILQPVSSILTNFNNKRHQKLMEADQNQWWETMGKLQKMLRKAAQVLLLARKIDRDMLHNYFMSVTEREVVKGILTAKNTKEHTMAYIRYINNVNITLLRFARNFIDMAARNVDNEAQKLLSTLRDDKLPKKLVEENIARFKVEWSGREGIDKETHGEYLKGFCEHFYKSIIKLVDQGVEANRKLTDDKAYGEILQHLHACHNFCKIFQGREEVVQQIRNYMVNESNQPLILWGESGCGKTSLLAKAYSQVRAWLPRYQEPMMVLRFLGTSPDSSSIIPLLTSLCQQIAYSYDQPKEEIPDELTPLIQHFKNLITYATIQKPLILFLDSLDQLSGADGAHQLAWLPVTLPPNMKVVLSTLPNYFGILDRLHTMVENGCNYVQVTPLGENLSSTILQSWMKIANRKVTDNQWKVVMQAISKCNLPLFVKLVFDDVMRWRSYSNPRHTTLAHSIHDSINKLFDLVENQYGKVLVSHALGYLTASKSGLSEAELDDVLSLDEKVLNDVYEYHLPPVRRIPPLLWTRIRNKMPNYFSEREADGVNVIDWYHRQFIEASRERYFRNLNFLSEIHSGLGDYFLGIWGGKPKPFEYSELQRQRFFLEDRKGEADRHVPEQPLYFADAMGNVVRYNLRKLSELPYHLIRCNRLDDLYKEVVFNYKFLHAKISCMPLQSVLADFEDANKLSFDKEVEILADALRLSSSILSHYPSMVGPQIVGRLLPLYPNHEKIRFLINQCDTDGVQDNALMPSYHCMHTPGGPLQYSLEGHPFAPFGICMTSDAKYLVSVSKLFIIWDLHTGDVYRQISPPIQGIMQNLVLSPDNKFAVSYTNTNQVVICSIMTGDFLLLEKPVDGSDPITGTALNNTNIIVWTTKEWYLFSMEGKFVSKEAVDRINIGLIHVEMCEGEEHMLVWKSGEDNDDDMTLEIKNGGIDFFDFHSAIAVSKDRSIIYSCIAISDDAVAVYKKQDLSWKYDRTLGDNNDKVFSLTLSRDENFLVATIALGYKIWNLTTDKMLNVRLPHDVRNIPNRNQLTSLVAFTNDNQYLVSGVRKNIYVWEVKTGEMIKTLDAHFGRIVNFVLSENANKVISGSIDKTIKVWNFDNIREDVYAIDRCEKPIEAISLASKAYIGVTTTRNCVGIWDLQTGRLLKTLSNSAHSSIVTHSVITDDAMHVISAESGNILIWDVEKEQLLKMDPQRDVQQMMLTDNDTKVIVLSRIGGQKGRCVCRTVPCGQSVYDFEFAMKSFKSAVVTSDGLYLVIPSATAKNADTLSMYHAKTGTHMYEMTPKYNNYKDYTHLVAMPNEPTHVALIDSEKGNIWDVKKKSFVRSVQKWNGLVTRNGKYGIYAPSRGGMELLDLKTGKVVHTLIPRVAEGVFEVNVLFTKSDQHVIYYHSGRRSIRVFRVSDGKRIADFKAHAEINAIESTPGGTSIVLGAVDGSVVTLTIADPKDEQSQDFLLSLPSRQYGDESNGDECTQADEKLSNGHAKLVTTLQVARVVAKAKNAQKSRACVIQ